MGLGYNLLKNDKVENDPTIDYSRTLMQLKVLIMDKSKGNDMVYFKIQSTRHTKIIYKKNGHVYGMELNGI